MSLIQKLMPMIEPSTRYSETRVHRPLFLDHKESPLHVFYADLAAEGTRYLTPEIFAELGISIEEIEKTGISNWLEKHSDLPWEEIEICSGQPPLMRSRTRSQAVSSILLSHGHLKGMHQHFHAEFIYVAIPNRFTVLVHSDASLTAHFSEKIYRESSAEDEPLSSNIYLSKNGQIVGYVQRDADIHHQKAELRPPGDELTVYGMQKVTAHLFTAVASSNEKKFNLDLQLLAEHLGMLANQGQGLVNQAYASMLQNNLDILEESASMDSQSAIFDTIKIIKDLALTLSSADYRLFQQTSLAMTQRIGETNKHEAGEDASMAEYEDLNIHPDAIIAVFQSLFAHYENEQSENEQSKPETGLYHLAPKVESISNG